MNENSKQNEETLAAGVDTAANGIGQDRKSLKAAERDTGLGAKDYFAALIDGTLNLIDDRVRRDKGVLKIGAYEDADNPNPNKDVIQFYTTTEGAPLWILSVAAHDGSDKPGFDIRAGDATTSCLFIQHGKEGRIGIGIRNPQHQLDVNGDLRVQELYSKSIFATGNDLDVTVTGALSFKANSVVIEKTLTVTDTATFKGGLTVKDAQKILSVEGKVGIGTTTPSNALDVSGGVRIGSGYEKAAAPANGLIVQGKVGIGTPAPSNALDVSGGVRIGSGYEKSTAPANGLIVQGNVSIGTSTPQDALDVNGAVRIVTGSNPIRFTSEWSEFTSRSNDAANNHAEISNDTGKFKVLMIVGNKSYDPGNTVRRVGVWDQLDVNGSLNVLGTLNVRDAVHLQQVDGTYKKLGLYRQTGHDWAYWYPLDTSDGSLKKDGRSIPDALNKVMKLRGSVFRWNAAGQQKFTKHIDDGVSAGPNATELEHQAAREKERQKVLKRLDGDCIGLMAQDVESVVPEVVYEDEDGHKCIRYPHLVALLVEAIKEQQALIQTIRANLDAGIRSPR